MREFRRFMKAWGFVVFLYVAMISFVIYTAHYPDPSFKLPATKSDVYFAMILILVFGRK